MSAKKSGKKSQKKATVSKKASSKPKLKKVGKRAPPSQAKEGKKKAERRAPPPPPEKEEETPERRAERREPVKLGTPPTAFVATRHVDSLREREARGFSFGELASAGVPLQIAKGHELSIDVRRRSVIEDNVGKLKGWFKHEQIGGKKQEEEGPAPAQVAAVRKKEGPAPAQVAAVRKK